MSRQVILTIYDQVATWRDAGQRAVPFEIRWGNLRVIHPQRQRVFAEVNLPGEQHREDRHAAQRIKRVCAGSALLN